MASRTYYILYDVTSDISFIPVDGKSEYGDMAHAKKRADAIHKRKVTWRKVLGNVTFGYIDDEVTFAIARKVKPQTLRSKNPVKRKTRRKAKRKGNPERITQAWLDKRVSLLNDMLGRPQTQYTKTASGITGNRGHLFIDNAYGGVKVAEMAGDGTGENNISDGYVPKKELNNFINGMIAAVRLLEINKRGRKKNTITSGDSSAYDGKGEHIVFIFNKDKLRYVGKSGKDFTLETVIGKAKKFKTLGAAIHLGQRIQFPDWAKKVGTMKASNPAKFAKQIQKTSYGGKV